MSFYTSLLLPVFSSLPSILLVFILIYVINFYVSYFTRENPLPGPIPLPIVGNTHQMRHLANFCDAMHERYGDIFEFYVTNERVIMLNRADLAEKVLSQSIKSNYFIRSPSMGQGWEELGFTTMGTFGNKDRNVWSLNRKFLAHCLTSPKYAKEIVRVAQTLFSEVEEYWKELGDSASLELTGWISCINIDTLVRIVIGQKTYALSTHFNSLLPPHLKKPLPQSSIQSYSKLLSHIHSFNHIIQYFAIVPPFLRHYVPGFRHIAERMKGRLGWMEEELKGIVNERKREIESMNGKEELRVDLVTLMLTINTGKDMNRIKSSEFERPLTDKEIARLLMEVFGGGVDSTTTVFCITVYYICKHPAVKARLVSEIDATLSSFKDHSLSYDSIVNLFPYTSAVIKEASRILTAVPIVVLVASEDDEVAGYQWPAGTSFGLNYGGIHKNKAHWKDPETFRPERFLDDEIKPKTFLPFGGGMRACPGRLVAEKIIKTYLISLFWKFEVELCEPDEELKYASSMLNSCTELKVNLRARNKKE